MEKGLEIIQHVDEDQLTLIEDQIMNLERKCWRMIDDLSEATLSHKDTEETLHKQQLQISADIDAVSEDDIEYIFQSM